MIGGTDDLELLRKPPSLRLDGRVVWVTGAGRGLGRTLAYAFAGAGADLALTARSAEQVADVADAVRAHGRRVIVAPGSVAAAADVAAAVEAIEAAWGRLDVLVNNAAISPTFNRAEGITAADWERILGTNLTGAFACSTAALPLLRAGGGGSVVNISSVHGRAAHQRLAAYGASKGGLEMLTRSLAQDWADYDVRVNAVAPGYFDSEFSRGVREHDHWGAELLNRIPMGRFGARWEMVGAVLFLAGDASSYITGATLAVDGGWTAG